ncbi:MAG: M23 family metallopeptidase [Luteolibacter sp.]|jgi:murein DD-endopeptidase MepM/ murein hydrolase activator NlpD
MLRTSIFFLLAPVMITAAPLDLRLPTENRHLFSPTPERFYMYVDRNFEGEQSQPWEGGAYGYVRTPIRVRGEVVMTRFHEGIDIAPVKRDRAGNPLDLIMSIADGTVVYASNIAGRSNYGKYIVVEHEWEGASVVSLYAHLAEITCEPGDKVKAGSVLGRMGYTGVGLNRTRAHLHLELGFVLHTRYEAWHRAGGLSPNHHGIYNGMNIAGADVAAFFLAHRENPDIKFSEFIASQPVHFKVVVPGGETPEFVARHPWIRRPGVTNPASWEIHFTATGLPVGFSPSDRQASAPIVTAIRPSGDIPHRFVTRDLVTGEGHSATLSNGGRRLVALVTGNF